MPPHGWRRSWIGDLDDDGHIEVLFVPVVRNDPLSSSIPLICYSDRGVEKWRFVPNKTVVTLVEAFAPPYVVQQFAVVPVRNNSFKAVLVNSYHHLFYPDQVALLPAQGEVIREYWHSGRLDRLEVADGDGDGINEIYLGGISNAHRAATLVVLDPESFGGASLEQVTDYQLQGFAPGKERARVLFQRSCLNKRLQKYNGVEDLWVQPGQITVVVGERADRKYASVWYRFTGDLKLKEVVLLSNFRSHHVELEAAGILDHKLTPAEEAQLRNIRYLTPPPAQQVASGGAAGLGR